MDPLLHVHEPAPGKMASPPWGAFLELDIRLLYIADCFWVVVFVALGFYTPQ